MKKLVILALAIPALALAADAGSNPILDLLDKALAFISGFNTQSGIAVAIAAALEIIMRLAKTQQPLSIVWLISKGIRKLSDLLEAIAELLDKVLPQHTSK